MGKTNFRLVVSGWIRVAWDECYLRRLLRNELEVTKSRFSRLMTYFIQLFPIQVNVGEWICFPNMGAYTIAAASQFNGFKQPSIVYMVQHKFTDYIIKPENEASVTCSKNQLSFEKSTFIRKISCVNWSMLIHNLLMLNFFIKWNLKFMILLWFYFIYFLF